MKKLSVPAILIGIILGFFIGTIIFVPTPRPHGGLCSQAFQCYDCDKGMCTCDYVNANDETVVGELKCPDKD